MLKKIKYLFMTQTLLLTLSAAAQEANIQSWNKYLLQDCSPVSPFSHQSNANHGPFEIPKLDYLLQVLEFGVGTDVETRFLENLSQLQRGEDQEKWQGITERALRDFRESVKDRALYAITAINDPSAVERLEVILGKKEASPFLQRSICEAIEKLQVR